MNTSQIKKIAVPAALGLILVLLNWYSDRGQDNNTESADISVEVTTTTEPSSGFGSEDLPAETKSSAPSRTAADVALSELPSEAAQTWLLIENGGPYPYSQDDGTFGNFEGLLPDKPRGYYREYTIETPGLSHRGARRFVVGDGDEVYYTGDHYESFESVDVGS